MKIKILHNKLLILMLIFSVGLVRVGYSQLEATTEKNDSIHVFNPIVDNIADYIPPLSVLIDSALENSYLIKSKYYELQARDCQLTTKKREITRNLSANLSYSYGNQESVFSNINEAQIISTLSNQVSNRWGIGVTLRVPLNELLDRKNQLNKERFLYESFYNEYSSLKQEIKLSVIEKYNELIFKQKSLQLKHTAMIDYFVQLKMAELEFKNAQISMGEMSKMRVESVKTQVEYEQMKYDFVKVYYLLQELVGCNFNILKVNF